VVSSTTILPSPEVALEAKVKAPDGRNGGTAVMSDDSGWALGLCIRVVRRPLILLTKRDWRGAEHIPPTGGCVIAVNHVSEFDPLTAAHFVYDSGRLPRFLGKVEVFRIPVLGWVLRNAGQIPVYRQSVGAAAAFRAAVEAVESGRCVIVYPEGTITRDPDQWPMAGKTGVARIALATGCPLIPVAQWGPQEVLPPYTWLPRILPRKLILIRAGAPVDLTDLAGEPITPDLLKRATDRVLDAITGLLEEIRGESAPARRFDPLAEGVSRIGRPAPVPRRDEEPT
jgi:1-acyl-sn-glycerol-3-phosphate acyltransferase